jgi:hypothetical protein
MSSPNGAEPPEGPRPWWDKALDPLRTEEAMFKVLLWVLAVAAIFVAALFIGRAAF